jgi:hypothetical protein
MDRVQNPCNPELLYCFLVRSVSDSLLALGGQPKHAAAQPVLLPWGTSLQSIASFNQFYFQSSPFAILLGIRPQCIINVKPSDMVFLLTCSISSAFLKLETWFVHCRSCLLALSNSIIRSNSV